MYAAVDNIPCRVESVLLSRYGNQHLVTLKITLSSGEPRTLLFRGSSDLDDIGYLLEAEVLSVWVDDTSQAEFGTVELSWLVNDDEDVCRLSFNHWEWGSTGAAQ